MKLNVCYTPALLPLYDIKESIVVVIDIFRATSSMTYGIENGAEAIIPVASPEECRSYEGKGCLLAAERDGMVVNGFDFGNSPFSYTREKVAGKSIVLTTTNGTYAIRQSSEAAEVIAGSFLNLSALCTRLLREKRDILLLCAGWKNKFNLEDTLFAGAVVNRLRSSVTGLDDAGLAAETIYNTAAGDLRKFLKQSSHTIRLQKLGIEEDIRFCLQTDICTALPVLKDGKLVRLEAL